MQALAAMQAIQSRHFLCYLLGLPADACPKAGRHAEAMKAIEDGLVVASSHQRARPRGYKKQWLNSQTEDARNRHEAIFDQGRQTRGAARATRL